MSEQYKYSLTKAASLLIVIAIISKSIGFLRELIYAHNFGVTTEYDVFLVSAAIPVLINTTIFYLGQNYFIPAYHKYSGDQDSTRNDFLGYNLLMFFLLGVVIFLILLINCIWG